MNAYSESDREALRTRDLLTDWRAEGFLTEEQYRRMEQDTVCELRRTNIFLRVVLFLFTAIILLAGVALFFAVFRPEGRGFGVVLMVFAAMSYGAAEYAVSRARLYRYGIEEALAVCFIGFVCTGLHEALFGGASVLPDRGTEWLVPATGVIASLWIWRRFGFACAFVAAMVFAAVLPGYWITSNSWQHLVLAAIYAAGLILVASVGAQRDDYSLVEALLSLGIYLAINLRISAFSAPWPWRAVSPGAEAEFAKPFYWTTWVLIWCLPPLVLMRGLRRKDRALIAVGAIVAVLTLVTNKPYLGWPRHTWDPMLLGVLLAGVALSVRRWLAAGPDGIRHGFTARRLSAKDKQWMSAGSVMFGLASAHTANASMPAGAHGGQPQVHFGGGDSGGGGATSDF